MTRGNHERAPLTPEETAEWDTIVEKTGRLIPWAPPELRAIFIFDREQYLMQREEDGDV
ncbi:hypothetical protein [Rhodococcoides fascians]|uniref:hypothetical protein n=1 Tax=Rhodococcoides fascians TaxID=1828 RepID=UPI001D88E16B|nr:hypothetical protein [Rhodococcus fascians]CAH0189738.1 hypothetical protein SRABI91_01642 [Rhodococcus fascians]